MEPLYQVTKGRYLGRIGTIKHIDKNTVMFYPVEKERPYMVQVSSDSVKKIVY